jgi:hypothetical protein
MKKSLLVACALVAGFQALPAGAGCTLETLKGTMAWSTTSFSVTGSVSSGSGQESYDGRGNMKYFELYSDGLISTSYAGTGTYTLSESCIAVVTYDSETVPWVYFVSADGDHYYWNNNQGNGVINSGRADRVSTELLVKLLK